MVTIVKLIFFSLIIKVFSFTRDVNIDEFSFYLEVPHRRSALLLHYMNVELLKIKSRNKEKTIIKMR